MSVKLGFLSANSSDMQEVCIVKQDIKRDSSFKAQRSGEGDIQSVIYSEKAKVHLETDHLTTVEVYSIRNVLANRVYPHKLFLQHPATNQEYTFDTVENKCYSKGTSDEDFTDFDGYGIEFSTQDYIDINTWNDDTVDVLPPTANDYVYIQFTADLSDFINTQGTESITRITLALKSLFLRDGDSVGNIGVGYKIDYWDISANAYIEIKRSGITVGSDNTIYASIRPVDNFSSYNQAFDLNNIVKFRIRNLYEKRDPTDNVSIQVDFAKIFVNGYGCVWNNEDNFTYRDTYTGSGWTGNLDLLEL